MLDTFIKGGRYTYTDSTGVKTIDFGEGLYKYKNNSFIENFGEYTYDSDIDEGEDEVYKRVIIYTLQD